MCGHKIILTSHCNTELQQCHMDLVVRKSSVVIVREQPRLKLACAQGSHRLEKYLNLEGLLEKSLEIKSALKSPGKSFKGLEKTLNSTIFCMTQHC